MTTSAPASEHLPAKELAGKVVVMTGASRGLGRAMAIGIAAAGADLVITARPTGRNQLREVAEAIRARREGVTVAEVFADISREEDCEKVREVCSRMGPICGLVNNAGIGMDQVGPNISARLTFLDVSAETWRLIIDTNINGTYLMSRAIAPLLVEQGHGRIVNVTTSLTTMQRAGFSPYGPSKAAVEAMTAIWAQDLEGTGVTVNALLPGGPADTTMIRTEDAPDRAKLLRPEVMVDPIVWLLSSGSDGVSGMRFIAREWDPEAPRSHAALIAGSPAAW